jgi:hypothetical protein
MHLFPNERSSGIPYLLRTGYAHSQWLVTQVKVAASLGRGTTEKLLTITSLFKNSRLPMSGQGVGIVAIGCQGWLEDYPRMLTIMGRNASE